MTSGRSSIDDEYELIDSGHDVRSIASASGTESDSDGAGAVIEAVEEASQPHQLQAMFLGSLPSLYPALFGGGRSPPAAGQRFSLDLNSPTPPGAGETAAAAAAQSSPCEAAADAAADDADVDTDHDSLDTADEGDDDEEEAQADEEDDEEDAGSRRPGQRMLLLAGLLSAAAFGMGLLLLLASSGSSNGLYHSSNSSYYYYNHQHYSHPYGLSISVPDIAVLPAASPAAPRRLVSYDSVAGDRAVPAAAAALNTAATAGPGRRQQQQQQQQQPKASRCSRLYHSRPQESEVTSSGEPQAAAPARSCSIHTPKASWWLAAPEATRKRSNSVLPAVQASHLRANATPGLWLLLQPTSGSAGSACAAAALAANQAAWESAMTAFGARLLARRAEAPTAAAPATATTCKPSPLQDWSSLLLWFSSGSAASPRPAALSCSLNVSQPWQLMLMMRQPTPPAATSQPPRWWYSCTAQESSQAFSCVRHAWNEWPGAVISHGSNSTSELWLLLSRPATATNSMCPVQTCAAQRSSLVLLLLPAASRATCKQLARAAVAAHAAACDASMLHAMAAASAAAPAPPSNVLHTPVLPPRAAATLATVPSFIVAQPTRAVPPLYRPPLPCLAVRARGGAKASRMAAATAAATTTTPALRHRVLQQLPAGTADLALSRPWLLLLPYSLQSNSSRTQMRSQGSLGATSTGGIALLWTTRSRDEAAAAPSPPPMTCDASSKQQAWGAAAAAAAAATSKAAAVVQREPSHMPPHARSHAHGAAAGKPQSCALWEAHFHVPATNNRPHRKLLAELQDCERHQHQRTQPATCSSGSSGSFLLVHKLLPITAGGAAAAAAGHQQQQAATSPDVMRQLLGLDWDLYEDEDDYADLNDIPSLTDGVTDDGDGGAADSARLSTFQQLYQEAGMPCGIPQAATGPAALTALAAASALKVAPPPAASPVALPAFAMAAQRVVRAPPPPPPRCSNNDTLAVAVAASTRLAAAASEVNSFLARVNKQLVAVAASSSASAPAKARTQHPRCINRSSSPLALLLAASQQAASAARDTAAAVVPAAQWVASFISLPMLPPKDEPQAEAEHCSNAFEAVIRASVADAAAWRAGSNASETAGHVATATGCASRTPLWTGQVL